MSQKGSYVWDDWSDDETPADQEDELFGGLSVSSLGLESHERSHAERSSDTARSAAEIAQKVDRMKRELREKTQAFRELQAELQRVRVAKERRVEKVSAAWEGRLTLSREENSAAMKKAEEFQQRARGDVKRLQEQVGELAKRLEQNQSAGEGGLESARVAGERRRQQARRQWEADEKISFDKVVRSKAEGMQKAAGAALGPKIDRLVSEGKVEVVRVREEGEVRIQKMQLAFNTDHEKRIGECQDLLSKQIATDLEKMRRQLLRKREEAVVKRQAELVAVGGKLVQDKRAIDVSHERSVQLEEEAHQKTMAAITQREDVGLLLEKHSRELGFLESQQEAEGKNLHAVVLQERREAGQKAQQVQNQIRIQNIERKKSAILRKVGAETERVLARLREEAASDLAKLRREIDDEVRDVRGRAQEAIEQREEGEEKEMGRVAALNGEIEALTEAAARNTAIAATAQQESDQLRPKLAALRKELREVEEQFTTLEPAHVKALAQRRLQLEGEVAATEERGRRAREGVGEQRREQAREGERVEREYVAELSRIKDKIALLLRKKEAASTALSDKLQELSSRGRELQDQLEDLRELGT